MRILIVGAGSEIAENIVKYHVDNKDDVSIIDHPSNKNNLVIDAESVSKYFIDVTDYSAVKNFFDSLDRSFEKLYFLVGTNIFKDVFSVTNNDWDHIMDTNLKSFFFFPNFLPKNNCFAKKRKYCLYWVATRCYS